VPADDAAGTVMRGFSELRSRILGALAGDLRRELLAGLSLLDDAVGTQLPELGVLDPELAGIELRVDALLLLLAVVLERLQRGHLQHQDADDVQPRHG